MNRLTVIHRQMSCSLLSSLCQSVCLSVSTWHGSHIDERHAKRIHIPAPCLIIPPSADYIIQTWMFCQQKWKETNKNDILHYAKAIHGNCKESISASKLAWYSFLVLYCLFKIWDNVLLASCQLGSATAHGFSILTDMWQVSRENWPVRG